MLSSLRRKNNFLQLAGSLGSNDHKYLKHAGFVPKGMADTEENVVCCCRADGVKDAIHIGSDR